MGGFADIDPTDPLGSNAVHSSAQLRDLKTAVLGGVIVEHDDGQTTAGLQGLHSFPWGNTAAIPASATRPNGHFFVVNDTADVLLLLRNNTGLVAYKQVGVAYLTKVSGSVVVNTGATGTVNIQAWAAGHKEYVISAYTNAGTTPTVVFSNITGADICVWVERVKGGQDRLRIRNDSGTNETVYYSVRQCVG